MSFDLVSLDVIEFNFLHHFVVLLVQLHFLHRKSNFHPNARFPFKTSLDFSKVSCLFADGKVLCLYLREICIKFLLQDHQREFSAPSLELKLERKMRKLSALKINLV